MTGDTPEEIRQCLSCEMKDCDDCIGNSKCRIISRRYEEKKRTRRQENEAWGQNQMSNECV